jgi:hypothetical protein
MSVVCCALCEELIDTDFHLETDGDGNSICNKCAEEFKRCIDCSKFDVFAYNTHGFCKHQARGTNRIRGIGLMVMRSDTPACKHFENK